MVAALVCFLNLNFYKHPLHMNLFARQALRPGVHDRSFWSGVYVQSSECSQQLPPFLYSRKVYKQVQLKVIPKTSEIKNQELKC